MGQPLHHVRLCTSFHSRTYCLLQTDGHTDSFGAHSFSVTHTYSAYANYTISVVLTNSVAADAATIIQTVEPNLNDVITIAASQTSQSLPVDVNFTIALSSGSADDPVWMSCTFDYGDGSAVDTDSFVLVDRYVTTHTYTTTSVARANANVTCSNHVSDTSDTSTVILREEVTGLQLTTAQQQFAAGDTVTFTLSLSTGNFLTVEVDYDNGGGAHSFGIAPGVTTHSFTHPFTVSDNYTISLNASNELYWDTTSVVIEISQAPEYCYQPNVTFAASWLDSNNPTSHAADDTFSIVPDQLQVDCLRSNNATSTTWQVRAVGSTTVAETQSNTTFQYTPRSVWLYFWYKKKRKKNENGILRPLHHYKLN